MEVRIRECEKEDYDELVLLNKKELGYDYSAELTKERLEQVIASREHKIYVALVDDKVVGYVHANNYDVIYAPHLKNIMGIAVSSNYRRRGIGKLLLTEVEKWAKETGANGIRLVSGASRADAHSFYRACGYEEVKEQKNFRKPL